MRFVALDLETTSMDARSARVVELYAAEVSYPDLEVLGTWHTYVDPETSIPAEATLIHGVSAETVKPAPTFDMISRRLYGLLDGSTVIAYNGRRFDVPVIANEYSRLGRIGPEIAGVIDPYLLFAQDNPRTLGAACQWYLNRDHAFAHTASADTHAMVDVLKAQLATRDPTAVAAEAIEKRLSIPSASMLTRGRDGQLYFRYGRYAGNRATDHPDYLRWVLRSNFEETVKEMAKEALGSVAAA